MNRTALIALLLAATPAVAVPGGPIGTLQRGLYTCELPGDAGGPAALPVPAENFAITNASSYAVDGSRGSYLLTGDTVTMTSGPKRGESFQRISANFLRKILPDGTTGPLRCVRRTGNTAMRGEAHD